MNKEKYTQRLKRGELEHRTNYIRCLNIDKCGQVMTRDKAIKIDYAKTQDHELLVEKKGFGNLESKVTNLTHTQVCKRGCGYQMTTQKEEQDELNTCDNPSCNNSLRMDEIIEKHSSPLSFEESKNIHEDMGHIVEDKTTYYCSKQCAVADQL